MQEEESEYYNDDDDYGYQGSEAYYGDSESKLFTHKMYRHKLGLYIRQNAAGAGYRFATNMNKYYIGADNNPLISDPLAQMLEDKLRDAMIEAYVEWRDKEVDDSASSNRGWIYHSN